MATIGISIGVSFALALVLGPAIAHWFGLAGIFWFTAGLALGGALILALVVPTPIHSSIHRDAEPVAGQFRGVLRNAELRRLDFGVLTLHMLMTALFLVIPLDLKALGLPPAHHWWVYLPVLVLSVLAMVPCIILAERGGHHKAVLLGAVAALSLALFGLYGFHAAMAPLVFFLFLFFTAFNLLEASLPSLISRIAPAGAKGTAMGVFATAQFGGAFLGGLLGGWFHQRFGQDAVLLFCAGAAVLWFFLALPMRAPRLVSSQVVRVGAEGLGDPDGTQRLLLDVPGVEEAVVVVEEGLAYLKVDRRRLDSARLEALCAGA
jgi:predicted MFS family arabinose efflux permease